MPIYRVTSTSNDNCDNEWATEDFVPFFVEAPNQRAVEMRLKKYQGLFITFKARLVEPMRLRDVAAKMAEWKARQGGIR